MAVPRIHLVEFYKPSVTADAAGAETIDFDFEFRAVVSFRIDRESLGTEGEIRPSSIATATVRMPFLESIDRGWRLKYQSKNYDVEKVRDPFGDRRELELSVVGVEL